MRIILQLATTRLQHFNRLATPASATGVGTADRQLALLGRQAEEFWDKNIIIDAVDDSLVTVVAEMIRLSPNNRLTLEWKNKAAERLMGSAHQALLNGYAFEARNLVEEVLAFHPQHTGAVRMWAKLVGGEYP